MRPVNGYSAEIRYGGPFLVLAGRSVTAIVISGGRHDGEYLRNELGGDLRLLEDECQQPLPLLCSPHTDLHRQQYECCLLQKVSFTNNQPHTSLIAAVTSVDAAQTSPRGHGRFKSSSFRPQARLLFSSASHIRSRFSASASVNRFTFAYHSSQRPSSLVQTSA